MTLEQLYPWLLGIASLLGMYVAYVHGRKTKEFKWNEYLLLLAVPTVGSLGLAFLYGVKVLYFFVASCVVGFVLEYLLGKAYHKTLNRRLWTYSKYSVDGYTSLLTIPMWGIAGIVFWLLANFVGL